MGALIGVIVLSQGVTPLDALGFALVVAASVGVTLGINPEQAMAEVPVPT
jgi:threonine/homoserine efflux transporter RhtA